MSHEREVTAEGLADWLIKKYPPEETERGFEEHRAECEALDRLLRGEIDVAAASEDLACIPDPEERERARRTLSLADLLRRSARAERCALFGQNGIS